MEIIKSIVRTDGKRRVEITQQGGFYSYTVENLDFVYGEELREALNDYSTVWIPDFGGGIFPSAEAAEAEVRQMENWLRSDEE